MQEFGTSVFLIWGRTSEVITGGKVAATAEARSIKLRESGVAVNRDCYTDPTKSGAVGGGAFKSEEVKGEAESREEGLQESGTAVAFLHL